MLKINKLIPKVGFGSNCYLLELNGDWVVIDPSVSYEEALSSHPEMAGRVKYVLVTHAHFDHILSIDTWSKVVSVVCVGAADATSLSDAYRNCYLGFLGVHDGYYGEVQRLSDGDKLSFGGTFIEVIATPGHTPGAVSYKICDAIFVGDTLFERGGYGRCDLPGGDISVLEQTLIDLFTRFKQERFYPGHGNSSTFLETLKYFN